jgi:hypothetical protein
MFVTIIIMNRPQPAPSRTGSNRTPTEAELARIHRETGVNVYAILELLKLSPTERLRYAARSANNLQRMKSRTKRK